MGQTRRSVLAHAWHTRARPRPGSAEWARLWAKRLAFGPTLLRLNAKVARLRRRGADIGDAVTIGGATISGPAGQLTIGDGTAIDAATIRIRGRITIGRAVAINNGATIMSGTHDVASPTWELVPQDIVIEDHAWIGTNAIVLGGCRIGAGAVVSAGSVVGKDVPAGTVVLGNPARAVGARDVEVLTYVPSERWPLWRAWWGLRFDDQMRSDDADPG